VATCWLPQFPLYGTVALMNALHSETCCLAASKRDAAHQAHCSVQALERAFPKVAVLGHSGRNQGVGKLH